MIFRAAISILLVALCAIAQPPMPMASVVDTNAAPEARVLFQAVALWDKDLLANSSATGLELTVSNRLTNYTDRLNTSASFHPIWVDYGPLWLSLTPTNASGRSTTNIMVTPYISWQGKFQATTNGIHWMDLNGTQQLAKPIELIRAVSWANTNWK
jgi:hypothetical protein